MRSPPKSCSFAHWCRPFLLTSKNKISCFKTKQVQSHFRLLLVNFNKIKYLALRQEIQVQSHFRLRPTTLSKPTLELGWDFMGIVLETLLRLHYFSDQLRLHYCHNRPCRPTLSCGMVEFAVLFLVSTSHPTTRPPTLK